MVKSHKFFVMEVVPILYTLEKMFLTTATFEGLCVITFQTELKILYVLWSVCVLFTFIEKRGTNKYCL